MTASARRLGVAQAGQRGRRGRSGARSRSRGLTGASDPVRRALPDRHLPLLAGRGAVDSRLAACSSVYDPVDSPGLSNLRCRSPVNAATGFGSQCPGNARTRRLLPPVLLASGHGVGTRARRLAGLTHRASVPGPLGLRPGEHGAQGVEQRRRRRRLPGCGQGRACRRPAGRRPRPAAPRRAPRSPPPVLSSTLSADSLTAKSLARVCRADGDVAQPRRSVGPCNER